MNNTGIYLNPGNADFRESIEKEIYVDKSLLISKVWENAKRLNKYICVSRPRRFGKSTDANMLTAFFSKGCDSSGLFDTLRVSEWTEYTSHLNQYNVIHLNMQSLLSASDSVQEMIELLNQSVLRELRDVYGKIANPETVLEKNNRSALSLQLQKIFVQTGEAFIIIIDEWDCIFREYKTDKEEQKVYLDYLRLLLKDRSYVKLAYMTGILPIKKYGTHSALNMFDEISMIDAKGYSAFMGFTEDEVRTLCEKYGLDYDKMREWYDGYTMRGDISTYAPRSVVASVINRDFSAYWSQTETYEALKVYIDLNYDGLRDTVIRLLAGEEVLVDTLAFQNDMTTFSSKDDVLTLLIHLGYLGYRYDEGRVYIPNNEVKDIFIASVKNAKWESVTKMFLNANDLLEVTWKGQADKVAAYIEESHYETSVLQYNDENALAYTVSLAYITAKEYYMIVRELPAGKGFADIVFLPKKDKPAMVVELKWDQDADSGIRQIREKKYYLGLENYLDNLLLVGISYDKATKEHKCVIEKYSQ